MTNIHNSLRILKNITSIFEQYPRNFNISRNIVQCIRALNYVWYLSFRQMPLLHMFYMYMQTHVD